PFRPLVEPAANLGAHYQAVARERCERRAARFRVDAGDLLKVATHLCVGAVAAGRDDHALARRDALARLHDHAGDATILDRKAIDRLTGAHRDAARAQRVEEM